MKFDFTISTAFFPVSELIFTTPIILTTYRPHIYDFKSFAYIYLSLPLCSVCMKGKEKVTYEKGYLCKIIYPQREQPIPSTHPK